MYSTARVLKAIFLIINAVQAITSHCKKEWRLQHRWRDRETLDGQNNHTKPTETRYYWGYEQCLYTVCVCVCLLLLLLIPWAMTQTGCKNKTDEYSWVALNPSDAPLYAVAMATTSGFCQFNTTWTKKKYHFSLVWVLHLEILSLSLLLLLFFCEKKKRESDTRRGKKDLKMSSCS